MKKLKRNFWVLGLLIFGMGAFIPANALAVDVYAEGAYTDTDLVIFLYADIPGTDNNILSYGVKLTYDNTRLSDPVAQKNESVWYMGDGTTNHPYMDPETDTSGEVVFIGGKLDTNAPTAGVGGTRVLLGTVSLTRDDTDDPCAGGTPESFFDVVVSLGRTSPPYANFVSTDSADGDNGVLDNSGDVNFTSLVIRERGDANADCVINVQDILRAKSFIGNPDAPPYVDCNATGDINVQDILCIKSKL